MEPSRAQAQRMLIVQDKILNKGPEKYLIRSDEPKDSPRKPRSPSPNRVFLHREIMFCTLCKMIRMERADSVLASFSETNLIFHYRFGNIIHQGPCLWKAEITKSASTMWSLWPCNQLIQKPCVF